MKLNNLVLEITIPDYLREVQLSKSRRAVYYEWRTGKGIRAWKSTMSKGKQIPKKLLNEEQKFNHEYSKNKLYYPDHLSIK